MVYCTLRENQKVMEIFLKIIRNVEIWVINNCFFQQNKKTPCKTLQRWNSLNTTETTIHSILILLSITFRKIAWDSWNAEVHIFAIQHANCYSSSISYKCCFVLILHWTSWNLLSDCQICVFSNGNMFFSPLLQCHLQWTDTYNPTCKRHLTFGVVYNSSVKVESTAFLTLQEEIQDSDLFLIYISKVFPLYL